MVSRLEKPGEVILESLTPFKCNLWHHGTGIASEFLEIRLALAFEDLPNLREEAGDYIFFAQGILTLCKGIPVETMLKSKVLEEVGKHSTLTKSTEVAVDAIKKHVIYGKELDSPAIVLAVKDALFHLKKLLGRYDITMEAVIAENKAKLAKRYENFAYTDKAAIERKDKA